MRRVAPPSDVVLTSQAFINTWTHPMAIPEIQPCSTRKARKRLSLDVFYTRVMNGHKRGRRAMDEKNVAVEKPRHPSTQSCKEPIFDRLLISTTKKLESSDRSGKCLARCLSTQLLNTSQHRVEEEDEISLSSELMNASYGTVFSPMSSPTRNRHNRSISESSRKMGNFGSRKKIKNAIVTPVRNARTRIMRKFSDGDGECSNQAPNSISATKKRFSASVTSLPVNSSPDLHNEKTRNENEFGVANMITTVVKKRRSDYFQSLSNWRNDKVTGIKTLRQFLMKKTRVTCFRNFLKKEFSEENLDFWLEVEHYRKQKTSKQVKLAHAIFDTYIVVNATREINIDAGTRATTKANMQKPDATTFDLAQVRVFLLMERDSFRRFLDAEQKSSVETKSSSSNVTAKKTATNKTKGVSKDKNVRRSLMSESKESKFAEIINSASITERRKRKFSS
uniref:regulator of G-protein signaling rgs-7-like isoform X2 n=1 Tax=Ciona intestinalis TaxID=7719 RepID=UPI000EF466DC|nr:regulator of G-protein signaling rgs-7-like isoform X2 [Ciona intestinalis]|eukprot:XP_026691818.1 regulator of G-protein signaling rgs-7-like isoform X2 [Ciona intestinalis]